MTKDLNLVNNPEELRKIFAKEKQETEDFENRRTSKMLHSPFYHFMVEMKPKVH
jgi:hypothetical protein